MTNILDSFNRANNATTMGSPDEGPAWAYNATPVAGTPTFGITSNTAYIVTSAGSGRYNIATVLAESDGIIEATFPAVASNTFSGLIVRYSTSDASSGIVCSGSEAYIGPSFASPFIDYSGADFAAGDRMRIILEGPSITVYRQPSAAGAWELKGSASTSTYQTNTRHGLAGWSVGGTDQRWDDFSWSPLYMPDVKVEIAFNAGYATPAGTRTWTDVSQWVELADRISISHGRPDEFGGAEANQMSLTLDNSDGRFTAGNASSPYYPNVKIGRPIRVTSRIGGTTYTRFLGYVDEWPTEWTGATSNKADAQISATSRMARLGLGAELRPVSVEGVIQTEPNMTHTTPMRYWTLGEPSGSFASLDQFGGPPLRSETDPVAFGGALFPEGIANGNNTTGVTFSASDNLRMRHDFDKTVAPFVGLTNTGGAGGNDIAVEFLLNGAMDATGYVWKAFGGNGLGNAGELRVGVFTGGYLHLSINDPDGNTLVDMGAQGPFVTSEFPLYVAAIFGKESGTNKTVLLLYVDGELIETFTAFNEYDGEWDFCRVGFNINDTIGHMTVLNGPLYVGNTYVGYDDMEERMHAISFGYAIMDTVAERFDRYATWANIPLTETDSNGDTPIYGIDTAGVNVLEAMRTLEETEGGVLFDTPDNTLTLTSRSSRYNTADSFVLDAATQRIEAGIAPKLDRSALLNDVTVTSPLGPANAIDQDSIDDYGFARMSMDTFEYSEAFTNDQAQQAAEWRVNLYSEPQTRIPSVGVDILPLPTATQQAIMGTRVGTRVAVTNLPSQAPATNIDFFIEGYTEIIGPESYMFDFNVSPTTGYDVWVLQDATYGHLDTHPLAY